MKGIKAELHVILFKVQEKTKMLFFNIVRKLRRSVRWLCGRKPHFKGIFSKEAHFKPGRKTSSRKALQRHGTLKKSTLQKNFF